MLFVTRTYAGCDGERSAAHFTSEYEYGLSEIVGFAFAVTNATYLKLAQLEQVGKMTVHYVNRTCRNRVAHL